MSTAPKLNQGATGKLIRALPDTSLTSKFTACWAKAPTKAPPQARSSIRTCTHIGPISQPEVLTSEWPLGTWRTHRCVVLPVRGRDEGRAEPPLPGAQLLDLTPGVACGDKSITMWYVSIISNVVV